MKTILQLVIGRADCGTRTIEEIITQAVLGGVTMVQLREKIINTISKDNIVELGKRLKKLLNSYNIPLIINDHVDIAAEISADGVHIGQQDMHYLKAREILGADKIIGLSITNLQEAKKAEQYPDIDYLGVGPIFTTKTKKDATSPIGITGLRKIKNMSRHRIIAIGGINESNIHLVLKTGIDGVAVVSAICAAAHPKQNTMRLTKKIHENSL
jgi:thiamine-phosphate diphosphorylase